VGAGEIARTAYVKHANDDDFGQPGTLRSEAEMVFTSGFHIYAKRTGWTAGGEKLRDIREGTHNQRFSGTL